jgi:TonB-dependent receptor
MRKVSTRFFFLLLFLPVALWSQTGTIAGKVIDAKSGETLIGCSVKLGTGTGGAITDFDGNFTIQNVPVGMNKITITYVGYQEKSIDEINVKGGEATTVDVPLEEPTVGTGGTAIEEVVIVAKAQRESMSALTILQKTSPTIADGISAESIKRTPDRTTGDVIRRISGASIQDNKFAVIRGLSDRYNVAMLNGALLSSTEPDRKAFSLDLFPAAMLDNLVILKTANPDLPGEFAGGVIQINTRDIPEESFLGVSLSGGYNNITTFKEHSTSVSGGRDWIGLDDGTRALPSGFPNTQGVIQDPAGAARLLKNDWAITRKSSAAPNVGVQLTGGVVSDATKKTQLGATFALSYSNSNRIQQGLRGDYIPGFTLFEYNDAQFKNNVLCGSLLNAALKIGNKNKIFVQSTYSINTDDVLFEREGQNFDQQRDVRATSIEYAQNQLLTTRLGGEHTLGERQIRLNWSGGINTSTRDMPGLRRMTYNRDFGEPESTPFTAVVQPGSAQFNNAGRFYSELDETIINANADISFPFQWRGQKQSLKVGGLFQGRDRDFAARLVGFTRNRNADQRILQLPQGNIFAGENIGPNSLFLSDITNPNDEYTAQASLGAAFIMLDNKIGEKFRMTWGVRFESYTQEINTFLLDGTPESRKVNFPDFLPSANMTYSLNDKNQLRFSVSRTVCRPELRELALFGFYDFALNATVQGNPDLTRATISNIDLRYELYPGQNQLFSVSLFYKQFANPIELTLDPAGGGTRVYVYQNLASAQNYGVEFELRKNFAFLSEKLQGLTLFGNAALIRSSIDLSKGVTSFDNNRPLQGQSPYVVNAGLAFSEPTLGLNTTLVYNIIGSRVSQIGTLGYGDIYERHRNLLDFQVSKRFLERGEIKLTISDLLRPDFIFYQDMDENSINRKYDEGTDNDIQRLNYGTTVTLGLNYRF